MTLVLNSTTRHSPKIDMLIFTNLQLCWIQCHYLYANFMENSRAAFYDADGLKILLNMA